VSKFHSRFYSRYKHSGLAEIPKKRRFDRIDRALGGFLASGAGKVIDLGCGSGADFIRFVDNPQLEVFGLDVVRREHIVPFTFIEGDLCRIDVPDKHFDAVVSIGVLEHIAPIEKLCEATREIRRVAKRFCVVVPSISTIVEPHAMRLFYPLRRGGYKGTLNYMSDETWLRFEGFHGARTERFRYLPLIKNLMIVG
jgi:SAM-dependent methyltransferase